MELVWVEYGGGNSTQITSHIVDLGGPIYDGPIFTELMNLPTSILYQPKLEGPTINLKLYEILMLLCGRVEIEPYGRTVNHEILKYIDDNIDHRLSLSEILSAFGYNPAYFSNCFPKMTGVSFSRYVMSRKISHACYLLETTSWSIENIAHKLGFCNMSRFIRRFKEIRQTTPLAHRNSSVLYQKRRANKQLQDYR